MPTLSKHAIKIILIILMAVYVFHICILLKYIPYNIAWGGRLKNDNEMYVFESLSILINLMLMLVLLMKTNKMKRLLSERNINIILWFFFALFILNTIGNLLAETNFEKGFAVLTAVMAGLIFLVFKKEITRTQ